MRTRESFYRPDTIVGREPRELAAAIYNRTHLLLRRSGDGCLFVPIRSMQYLAVVDDEEIIFVDANHRPYIELAWRGFRPQARAALDASVPFEVVYYLEKGFEAMRRLVGEFDRATRLLSDRTPGGIGAGEPIDLPRSPR